MSRSALIAHVVGARPNYMKVAPLYAALEQRGGIEQRLIHTGQHYDAELNDVFFGELPLPEPHVQLRIGSGSHAEQTGNALIALERVFRDLEPALVVVPGDVNSTLAGALAAAKLGIPVCHLEAGLRSFDDAMPEEHNRRLTDHLSRLLLTHSQEANENLEREGIPPDRIALVGNTMIDTLLANIEAAVDLREWEVYGLDERAYLLVTLHRPALVDDSERLGEAMAGLNAIADELPVVFPVHPRTKARLEALHFEPAPALHLTKPLGYRQFLSLEARAAAVLTDSGGVQEETTALGIPCFTLRANTERPVTVTLGTNTLLGFHPELLHEIPAAIRAVRTATVPPLWDGRAGERAAAAVESALARF